MRSPTRVMTWLKLEETIRMCAPLVLFEPTHNFRKPDGIARFLTAVPKLFPKHALVFAFSCVHVIASSSHIFATTSVAEGQLLVFDVGLEPVHNSLPTVSSKRNQWHRLFKNQSPLRLGVKRQRSLWSRLELVCCLETSSVKLWTVSKLLKPFCLCRLASRLGPWP
jgi:hypothetical protein